MFANHSAAGLLKALGVFNAPPTQAQLDAVEAKKTALAEAMLDAAGQHAVADIRMAAVSAVNEWAGTTDADLDAESGETKADRLIALAVGIADENKDGDITDDEAEVINVALNAMAEVLVDKGADEADVVALLEESDAAAGDRIAELIAGSDDADIDAFAFDAESSAAVMDAVLGNLKTGDSQLDAVYKKKMVIRQGKKVRINKRISGTVRLTAGQKVAVRKARLKAHTATASIRRMKSMKIRRRTIG